MPKVRSGSGGRRFRRLLAGREVVVVPGVFSPVVAQLARKVGFRAIYLSGGGFANLLGLPDLGVTTLTEVAGWAKGVTSVVDLPLIVDVDTGFGETVNVQRAVWEMERAGAAAIHLEDQVMPKRCGHLAGKEVVEMEAMVKKIIAAREARSGELVLIARTDARAVEGFDAAVERSRTYVKAGADMVFPEALENKGEFLEFAAKVRVPLLANMTEFGKTPYIPARKFGEMGYKVVIFPMTAFRATLKTVLDTFRELKKSGTQRALLKRMMTRKEIYELMNYYEYEEQDQRTLREARRILDTD